MECMQAENYITCRGVSREVWLYVSKHPGFLSSLFTLKIEHEAVSRQIIQRPVCGLLILFDINSSLKSDSRGSGKETFELPFSEA